MLRYSWLLFDADGTLFDYDQAEAKALQSAFHDFALPYTTRTMAEYHEINRQIWNDFENKRISAAELRTRRFDLLFEALGVNSDPDRFSAVYLRHLAAQTDLIAGAYELITTLRGRCRLGIITNGLHDVQRPRLERSTLAGMFDVVIVSEEIGAAKPEPAFFYTAFDRMGQPPKEEVLVTGDSLTSDIQGGINFGLDTCWYNPRKVSSDPYISPTYEITSLDQFIALLR